MGARCSIAAVGAAYLRHWAITMYVKRQGSESEGQLLQRSGTSHILLAEIL
jgi:hypothetical protein